MKDLYSFHATEADLNQYYDSVVEGYHKIFRRCGIGTRTHLTYASGGIFSKYSHEFQTLTEHGEDVVYLCEESGVAINKEIVEDLKYTCPVSGSKNLKEVRAIEVGNIFKLMRRFSDACALSFQDKEGAKQPVYMGCYGLGSSRLMGAITEILHDSKGICWPESVAPYRFHLVSLARADDEVAKIDELYRTLQAANVDVLYDDRAGLSAGEKFSDCDLLGIPTRLVMSSKTIKAGTVEWRERMSADAIQIPIAELLARIKSA
jgi:prolyl-tRNA synthetase